MMGPSCLESSQVGRPVWKGENWCGVPRNKVAASLSKPSSSRPLDVMEEAVEVSMTPHDCHGG